MTTSCVINYLSHFDWCGITEEYKLYLYLVAEMRDMLKDKAYLKKSLAMLSKEDKKSFEHLLNLMKNNDVEKFCEIACPAIKTVYEQKYKNKEACKCFVCSTLKIFGIV